jgi:hypothetical protein
MWVKISKPEDTKKLKVGDKVRVDGVEYEVTGTYSLPTDHGFDVDSILPHGVSTMADDRVIRFEYTIELWEEEESQMLERDKEYDIKLTGEQLAIVLLLTGCTNDYRSKEEIFHKIDNMSPKNRKYMQTGWINSLNCNKDPIDKWIASLFPKPETEQEKKIREMEEQYTALGRAIEEVKKGCSV